MEIILGETILNFQYLSNGVKKLSVTLKIKKCTAGCTANFTEVLVSLVEKWILRHLKRCHRVLKVRLARYYQRTKFWHSKGFLTGIYLSVGKKTWCHRIKNNFFTKWCIQNYCHIQKKFVVRWMVRYLPTHLVRRI